MSRKPLDKDLYADVVAEAKRKFDVWPSAYASGWVVKTYKARGGRYGGESKGSRTGLTKWFGESWVDLSRPIRQDGEVVGYEPCGRKRSGDPADYPKCRPAREAMRMTPAEVRDAIKRKRAAEAKAAKGRGGRGARAPVRVATYENPAPDTEAFRRWFGESKVVDKNGEPLVVYHGTDKGGFYSFDMGEADAERPGTMFFTSDRGLARTYTRGRSDPTPPYFKSVEDFLEYVKTEGDDSPWSVETEYYVASDEDETRYSDLDDLHEAWEDVADDEIGVVYRVFDVDGYDNGKFDSQNPKDMADLLSEVNRATTKKEGVYEVYLRIVDPYVVDAKGANWDGVPIEGEDEDGNPVTMTYTTNELASVAQDMGCDGLIVRDVYDSGRYGHGGESGDVFVVFDAKQIKSAHNIGTFDPTTDDIRRNPRLYEYQGRHSPPGPDDGAPMHDVDNMMPDYCAHPNWYFSGLDRRMEVEASNIVCAARGRPWAKVWVYRAVPPGVKEINPGDWVTQVRAYAKEHLESNLGGEGRILKRAVRAGSLFTEGNSHFEWGWWPDAEREREFERMLRERRAAMAR